MTKLIPALNFSYSKRKFLISWLKILGILIVFILILGIDFKFGFNENSFKPEVLKLIFVIGLGYGFHSLVSLSVRKLETVTDPIFRDIHSSKLGYEGEKIVNQWLQELLPNNYVLLRNIKIPGHKFDIDFVAIGAKGIIVFEVKNLSRVLNFYEDRVTVVIENKELDFPSYRNPRDQILRHVEILQRFLFTKGFTGFWIHKSIVFIRNGAAEFKERPGVYIAQTQEGLKKFIDNIPDNPIFTAEYCQKLTNLLRAG